MKKRGEFDLIYLAIFLILIILGYMSFLFWDGGDFNTYKGTAFCISKGYDSTSYDGSYSERYGKVECVSCYKNECDYKEFNVTMNLLRVISEVEE